MTTAIQFSHVSKFFRLDRDKPRAFQELFISFVRRRKIKRAQEFWALKDVSFNVERGETVGLIGSNGSGKSTSLKLITRIISPTAGTVSVNGRVTALLELGAGFHPELSGRDNIFLNGTVMGLSRKEIEYKADSIIEFAELQDFIDVPVKNYSSGMYARLGFSVSVHLDPDILLVDEVLSVGDQSFQQKCNERMLKLRRKGVTILFVSHDLDAVWRLCSRAIWLDHGIVEMDDVAHRVTDGYYKHVLEESTTHERVEAWAENRLGSGEAHITDVEFFGEEMRPRRVFLTNEPLMVRLHYQADQHIETPLFGLSFSHAGSGTDLAGPNNSFANHHIPFIEGKGYVDYHLDRLPFLPGDYLISTAIYDWNDTHQYDYWHHCTHFTVVPGGTQERYGLFALEGTWGHSESTDMTSTSSELPQQSTRIAR
ncbi:MAG: ABC transporter ATP-binding protein [Chloroflexi bacterium]|nr:ABC transporter ATP-binding protein [Chloroflexota bacterium]